MRILLHSDPISIKILRWWIYKVLLLCVKQTPSLARQPMNKHFQELGFHLSKW
uniref:Uncharacterized protein n=1 Tax=Rhizophora mucronata TaxID=61149 RepID=A0A2P2ML05_RHIMU